MIRRVLTVASALSLVLCAIIALLWVVSYWRVVEISYNCPTPPTWSVTGFWLSVHLQQGFVKIEYAHTGLDFPCYLPVVLFAIPPIVTAIGIARRRLLGKATRGFSVEPIQQHCDADSD